MNPNPYHFLTLLSRLLDREGSVLLTRTVDPDKSTSTDRIELGIPADELHGMGLATIAHVHDTHQLAMARGTESQALDIARMIAKLEEGTDPANEPPQPEQVAEAVEPNDPEDPFEDGTIVPGTTYGEDPGTDIDHDHDDEIEPPTDDGLHTDTGVEDSNQSEGC